MSPGGANLQQPVEPGMRSGRPIKVQPVTIKGPSQSGVVFEPCWVSHFLECQTELCDHRIRPPKALRAAEIRQARVDAHASASSDQKAVGNVYCFSGLLN